jgi:hypothetical protein
MCRTKCSRKDFRLHIVFSACSLSWLLSSLLSTTASLFVYGAPHENGIKYCYSTATD